MEFDGRTEHGQKDKEDKEHTFEDSEVGAQKMAMKGSSKSNTPELSHGDEQEEHESPKSSQASSASPLPGGKIGHGNPPAEDAKVPMDCAVTISSIPQIVLSAVKKGSIFSRSAFYYTKGEGRLKRTGHLKMVEAILRSAGAILSLVAFSVMTSTSETRIAAGSTFEVKFSDFQAYSYLVALNLISFIYSSAQVVVIAQSSSSRCFSSPIKSGVCKYFGDQILAFLMFSASSSAATASELARHGLHNIWPPVCSTWKLWFLCLKADAAVVISFFSSFLVMLSSLFSGFYLLHLLAV